MRLKAGLRCAAAALAAFATLAAVAAIIGACASMGLPPGGPVDKVPPVLLRVTPDSGALNVPRRQVLTFRFDEVVGERARSGGGLDQIVIVSPTEGPISVDWHRTSITVKSKKGWRPNIAYTVTILPGLVDLSANATKQPLQTVFSTGSSIPDGVISGIAFDWVAQHAATGARVEAMIGDDTLLKFAATTDSTGRFTMPHLPPGVLHVRAYIDQNNNRVLDARELWDSSAVTLADSARREFYMFAHDTIGPSMSDVTVVDSVTLRVHFDRPLLPGAPIDASQFTLKIKDSTQADSVTLPILRVGSAARFDSLTQQHKLFAVDSAMRADTSAAGRKALARRDSLAHLHALDSISNAQLAAVRASRDTTKKVELPKPSRPAPLSDLMIELVHPMPFDVFASLSVRDAVGLTGHVHHPSRPKQVVRRKPPPPKDSTAVGKKPPAAPRPGTPPVRRDSTATPVKKP